MKKEKFSYDKKRQVWIGQFHELQSQGRHILRESLWGQVMNVNIKQQSGALCAAANQS